MSFQMYFKSLEKRRMSQGKIPRCREYHCSDICWT